MKILISLTLLLSVLNFANAQEDSSVGQSDTPSGSTHCAYARSASAPVASTQSVDVEEADAAGSFGI